MKLSGHFLLSWTKARFYPLLSFIFLFSTVQAQNIPDPNFAAAIRTECPMCINATNDLLPPAASLVELLVRNKNIRSLAGIEGFTSLITLSCVDNQLASLPILPNSLSWLVCDQNQLTSLPSLPSSLIILSCNNNQLTSLPTLPNRLSELSCFDNQLTSLPTLPNGLAELHCHSNQLSRLPSLPINLRSLSLDADKISCLPNTITGTVHNAFFDVITLPLCPSGGVGLHIPDANFAAAIRAGCPTCIDAGNNLLPPAASLTDLFAGNRNITNLAGIEGFTSLFSLYCNNNQLTRLPSLPSSLGWLNCDRNQLTSLPSLPTNLTALSCDDNQLTSLPSLPHGLIDLSCSNNQLSSLQSLPSTLVSLRCFNNPLTILPILPSSLVSLTCFNNQLVGLPSLPSTLVFLDCHNNQITSLPNLPRGLKNLECYGNQLTSLPNLPSVLTTLNIDRSLSCLPNFVSGLTVEARGIGVTTLPVCTGTACTPTIVASPSVTSTTTQCGVSITLSAVASAVGTTDMTVTWQRKRPTDADFVNVTAAVPYTSGSSVTYSLSVSTADNSTQYRAVFSGTCADAVSIGTTPATISTRVGANVPDLYFRNSIRRVCPECLDGCNNLTEAAEQITALNVDNAASNQPISDLTGIEGFLNLEVLNISSNTITNFPRLPNKLKRLTINNHKLNALPELPSTLEVLICKNNNLTSLPALPSALMHLDCSSNKLMALPAVLPTGLMVLDCSNNQLTGLPPTLPLSIKTLYCQKNRIATLPTLPTSLNYFNCGNNLLSDLPPTLPAGLHALICSRNPTLVCLPTLPSSLRELYISPENVKCLRNSVAGLRVYDPMNEPIDNMPICNATTCVPFRPANEGGVDPLKKQLDANTLKAFPNPVNKQLYIEFTATEAGQATISVTDILGHQLSLQNLPLSKGVNTATVDMSNLPYGVYVITLQNGKTQAVRRIVKQ